MAKDIDPKYSLGLSKEVRRILDAEKIVRAEMRIVQEFQEMDRYMKAARAALGPTIQSMSVSANQYRTLIAPSQAAVAAMGTLVPKDLVAGSAIAEAGRLASLAVKATPEIRQLAQDFNQTKYVSAYGVSADVIASLRGSSIERFSVPAAAIVGEQLRAFKDAQLAPITRLVGLDRSRVLEALGSFRNPWLDAADAFGSVRHLVELQSIGTAIRRPEAYGDDITGALRGSLGDWRDPITADSADFSDLATRSAAYAERGLVKDLTDLPEEAFDEGLDALEIRGEPPPLIVAYQAPVPADDVALEAGLLRNNQAHDWLQRFETQLRRFINERMTAQYGEKWVRSRLPNSMLDRWLEKQQKDPNRERHAHLIVYADFTDYEPIVTHRGNFREVFAPFFQRPENFRESMFRLSLPRVEVSHARIITQDDALLLYAELRRLTSQFLRLN